MALFPGLEDEEVELQDGPAPVDTVAGPQTAREKVMQRISEVRSSSGNEGTGQDPDREMAAMEFARDSAMNAGMGRALNAFAGATGYKADNSGYDAMEKQGADLAQKEMDRSALVRKSIEERRSKEALASQSLGLNNRRMAETERHNRAMEALAGRTAGIKTAKNREIEMLPAEDQEVIKDLAKKNASKIAIANQIDALMNNWDSLPEKQRVAQGKQLIKVLNSTEGADAVGAEESKRLGGMLEFAFGNFTNDNPTQWGRDLEGFKEQSLGTINSIKNAVRANQIAQNDIYRKHGISRQDPDAIAPVQYRKNEGGSGEMIETAHASAPQITPQDLEALKWAKANPKDPRTPGILQRLQAKGLK